MGGDATPGIAELASECLSADAGEPMLESPAHAKASQVMILR